MLPADYAALYIQWAKAIHQHERPVAIGAMYGVGSHVFDPSGRGKHLVSSVSVTFSDSKSKRGFAGPVTLTTFGSEQYVWKPDGAKSYADPDGPPVARVIEGRQFTLPKASVTVIRGKIAGDVLAPVHAGH